MSKKKMRPGKFSAIVAPFSVLGIARKMREKDQDVLLIFETNIAKFALKGYEVEAMDYMLKPITYPMLCL